MLYRELLYNKFFVNIFIFLIDVKILKLGFKLDVILLIKFKPNLNPFILTTYNKVRSIYIQNFDNFY